VDNFNVARDLRGWNRALLALGSGVKTVNVRGRLEILKNDSDPPALFSELVIKAGVGWSSPLELNKL
jgi:hypothetical protein